MIQDQQKYLETLLFEWLILDFQPLYLLKSPSFRRFINALNEDFELPTNKEFRKRILEAYEFCQKQLKQYIQENAISVSLVIFGLLEINKDFSVLRVISLHLISK